jgi:phosphoserine aminotransferase
MKEGGKAAYLDTRTWASPAIKEAKFFGEQLLWLLQRTKLQSHTQRLHRPC